MLSSRMENCLQLVCNKLCSLIQSVLDMSSTCLKSSTMMSGVK